MPRYLATINIPGYLPMDDDPPVFDTAREAWEYLANEREHAEDYPETDSETVGELRQNARLSDRGRPFPRPDITGTVYGPTPGYDGDHDLGLAYCVTELPPSELDALRLPDGSLPQYTSIGSYPILYLTRDNDVLCAGCATKALNDPDAFDPPVDHGPFWEGAPERCEECNTEIPSAYGDPDECPDGDPDCDGVHDEPAEVVRERVDRILTEMER